MDNMAGRACPIRQLRHPHDGALDFRVGVFLFTDHYSTDEHCC